MSNGLLDCFADCRSTFDDEHPQCASFRAGFHHTMRAQLLDDRIHVVRTSLLQRHRGGSRDAGLFVVQLRLHFIHCQSARPYPATDIREPDRFQKTLHGAVFPIFPMQTEKSNVERTVDQTFQILLVGRIELRNGISGFFKGLSRAIRPMRETPRVPRSFLRRATPRGIQTCILLSSSLIRSLQYSKGMFHVKQCIMAAMDKSIKTYSLPELASVMKELGSPLFARSSCRNGSTNDMRPATTR